MAIETDFVFEHKFALGTAKATDLLGPLRGLIGHQHKRSWKGTGFNYDLATQFWWSVRVE